MKGWALVGRVKRATFDFDLWLIAAEGVRKGDVLRFSYREVGPLRAGSVQVDGLLCDGVMTSEPVRSAVPSIADGDFVFKATAIGENAFK